jgi:NAD(P)H-flavin reductase
LLENEPENWSGHTGLLEEDLIEDIIPGPNEDHLVIHCGQPGMNSYVRELLLDLGHSTDNVFQY